jgi:predicted Zn-dependent protease
MNSGQGHEIQRVMERELKRALKGLKSPGHPRPYFISYLLHVTEGLDVWGRYGSVFNSEPIKSSDLYAEVRVGSHRLDQTIDGGLHSDFGDRESYNWLVGPQDLHPEAVRYAFWKLTQLKYWEALQEYYDKKKILVEQHLRQDAPSFSKEPRVVENNRLVDLNFSVAKWEDFVRESSNLFKAHKNLVDPYVRIRGAARYRVFVNSEGSKFICQENFFEVGINAWYLTKNGVYLNSSKYFYGRSPKELPKMDRVAETIDDVARDLADLAKAPPMDPYAGPALLSGLGTGLIFHEAIGHRLEGERMVSRSEGHTFSSKIGKQILPKGVDLIDDPSLAKYDGVSLYGHYTVDDEGVRARPVKLVDDGVLATFLMSRACVPGFKTSNGHGRHERFQDPMARMANLIVQSTDRYSWDELKEMLLKEVQSRGLPHGIIVKNVSSGETRTDHYDFQAFKGVPTEVYSVDPRTGKEMRVRDVNFIGTPLAAIQRIKAFGAEYQVDNSYCFAESGSVPVSTVAPAMLVEELELQRASMRHFRPPILSFPPMNGR